MKTGKEAVAIMIQAYSEKRKKFRDEIKRVEFEIDDMRSNAKNKDGRIIYLETLKNSIGDTEEKIHELDTLDAVIEDYDVLQEEILVLCEKKRNLFNNPAIESALVTTKRDGACYVF
ncbi:MAG: hypothetical protein ACYTFK_12585 [Planctomycetota bacterium]|jgi:chromosome segregation ATPase